jgi:hypothetical protein
LIVLGPFGRQLRLLLRLAFLLLLLIAQVLIVDFLGTAVIALSVSSVLEIPPALREQ